jgi:histidinol-phosphatase (PHP family)
LIKDYYSRVANVVDVTHCDIIAHFDLVTKFNERLGFVDTDSKQYRSLALEALDALIEKNKIFEINTGAISRGWRKTPYPQDFLLKRLAEKKANVMLSSDSHSKDTVLYYFDEAIEYAKSCGVGELCIYKNKKIEKIKI